MSAVADLTDLLQQFTARYRKALALAAGIRLVLGLGLLGLLAWRLQAAQWPVSWSLGLPGVGAVVWAAALGWWLRRRWISRAAAASHVDRAFHLQQRLLTASEFASAPEPPSLLPLLIEDTARKLSREQLRVPRPWDRTASVLAALVLLLLLLPWMSRARAPLQLAQQPLVTPPPQTPPETPPPPPPNPQEQRPQSSPQSSASSGTSGAGSQSQQSSGSQSVSSNSSNARDEQQSQGSEGQPQQNRNQPPSTSRGQGAEQQPSDGSAAQRRPSAGREPGTQERSPSPSPSQGRAGEQAGEHAKPSSQAEERQGSQGAGRNTGSSGQDARPAPRHQQAAASSSPNAQRQPSVQAGGRRAQASGQQQTASQQAPESLQGAQGEARDSQQRQPGRGGGEASGTQEAMKAEIQQLLKEVSGEIQNLQQQLAAADNLPHPAPGTTTDPNLYGDRTPLESPPGTDMPIQLAPDAAPTRSPRQGGGVGQPSGEVSKAAPKVQAENAQLSDQPLEETPTAKQPVPPDYQSIFDRLRQQKGSTP